MSTTIFTLAIAAAIGADPAIPSVDPAFSNGAYNATEMSPGSNYPMTSSGVTGGIYGDPLYPFDSQYPWQHGYFQEISPYSGYHYFKPYNYRHVLSQTQTAAGWGITPQLSYSQHFWNRYQEQATWKNYALPPREKDIEEIQKRKRAYQEQQSSSYQQQPTMVPVQYQSPQQQNGYRQQYQQPAQQFRQTQPIQPQYPAATPRFNRPRGY
ncbi:hypothetical protein [uncultured Gimesia sp.]|uniref:hypothetical protein n=1 Tax=uncultured Gimesia sp. TaxID=1678688 RepID=UPI00262C8250|nr:hypothetical protein [uncultured Gimesia sp.]